MTNKFRFLPSVLVLLLCLTAAAFGQERTGNIEGTVKDPNGAVVPGAQVTVTSSGTSSAFSRSVTTDTGGVFRVTSVPPGTYTVAAAAISGFGGTTVSDVEVVLGKTTPVTLALPVGGQTANVNVSATEAAIDPTDNKIQTNITTQIAELLPKGTNFTSLLKVSPATRQEPLSGGFQVDGASGSENTFIIDGQEVTNFRTGVLNLNNNIPFQLVQEVQIKTSGFEAEFGGATGGVINVVTKGGSNEFHGEFGAQFRPSGLQSAPREFLRNFRSGSATASPSTFVDTPEYIQPVKDKGTDFFPTATLGGPIIKDRLWFFGSYTPQVLNTHRTIPYISSNPVGRTTSQTLVYNLKRWIDYSEFRLDAAPTDKLRLSGRFIWNPIHDKGAIPGFTEMTASPQAAVINGQTLRGAAFLDQQGGRQNSNNITGSAVWTPTSKLVLNFRAGRTFLNEKLGSYGIPGTIRYLCSVSSSQSAAVAAGCGQGIQNFATNFQIAYDVSTRNTVDADAAYLVSGLLGRHQFKGGYQYNAIKNTTDQGYKNIGQLTMIWGTQTIADQTGQDPTAGTIGVGVYQRFGTVGKASSNNQGFFFQDSWQPTARLSLNLGLRIEQETVPSFSPPNPGIKFGWGSKPAPRLGFAYDLTGNGKTKIFASFGWFYDRFKYELPRGSFGGDFYRRDYFELFPGDTWNTITKAQILGSAGDPVGGTCPDTGFRAPNARSRCQFDFRIPSNLIGGDLFDSGNVDPNIKAARQTEFTVGAEHDLGGGFLFRGRYTHKNVDRAIEDIGIPTAAGSEAYIIGNPGLGLALATSKTLGFPAAKAVRRYDAMEIQLDRRLMKNFYFNANYTFSRLFGNYSGLASSLEAGRTSPNVSRLFDLPFQPYNANGKPIDGRLPTDRPHVFKFYGAYMATWNGTNSTEFSAFTTAQSGTPLTTTYTLFNLAPAILNGLGDLGRTGALTQTDFAMRHKYKMGEKYTLVAEFDILNLFNEKNVFGVQNALSTTNVTGTSIGTGSEVATINTLFATGIRDKIATFLGDPARPDRRQSTFGKANNFQLQREVRFGFRLIF